MVLPSATVRRPVLYPGGPHAATVAKLRAASPATVTPEDIDAVIWALLHRANGGNMAAIKELLDRAIGKPTDAGVAERFDELEALATALQEKHFRRSS